MNHFINAAWASSLLLLYSCIQEQRTPGKVQHAFYPYTLGAITMRVPASWKPADYTPDSADSTRTSQTYVFVNAAQPDSAFRDAVVVSVKKRNDKMSGNYIRTHFVEGMQQGSNRVSMLTYQDTVLADRELVLIDFDNDMQRPDLTLTGTYACYLKGKYTVSIVASARKQSTEADSKSRALFRKIIYSVKGL
ncbi:hypothetical protein LGH70_00050 [Hymenobacter sp. BT635]|uniref:DUF4136 domain-containing protein n=1 Tax=Hymenobacter nitidus TaxID=2880929 RepID=A0ABS8A7T8_9BACT|nr:hypothetical protein [Hymenobacter nitidus]MCB2375952.1 hypothetical protein [Hymenobacter nitidus]